MTTKVRRPHVLFIGEKYCDGMPQHGITNCAHLLWDTLEESGLATQDHFHFDEYYLQHGEKGDEALLELCRRTHPDLIVLSWLHIPGRPFLNPEGQTLTVIKQELRIPILALWWDSVNPVLMQLANALTPYVTAHVPLDSTTAYLARTRTPEIFRPIWAPMNPRVFYPGAQARDIELSFNGSVVNYADRQRYLNFLTQCGIPVTKVGGQREERLDLQGYADIYRRSKMTLNFCKAHGQDQMKGRVFEALMCGTLLLEQANPVTRQWLVPGEDYVEFENEGDLVGKIAYYLGHEEERARIAQNGSRKVHRLYTAETFWQWMLQYGNVRTDAPAPLPSGLPLPKKIIPIVPAAETASSQAGRVWCAAPWYTFATGPEGVFTTCCHIKSMGVAEVPSSRNELMQLWNSPNFVQLRSNLVTGNVQGTPCETCYDRLFDTDHDITNMVRHLHKRARPTPGNEIIHAQAEAAYQRGDVVLDSAPQELYAFVSELCNLKCVMCTQNIKRIQFPTDRWIKLIEEIGWDAVDRFGFIGGETLLGKDGLKLLRFAADANPPTCVYITTNGTLLYKHMETLNKIGNLFMTVSVDGVSKVYEKIRVNSAWHELMGNLELLREAKRNHPGWKLNINSVLMNSTYPLINEVIQLGKYLDASIFFSAISGGHPEEDFFNNPLMLDSYEDFEDCVMEGERLADVLDSFKARDSLEKFRHHYRKMVALRAPHLLVRQSERFRMRAMQYVQKEKLAEAIESVKESLELHPFNVKTLSLLSEISLALGNVDGAKALAAKSLAIDPENKELRQTWEVTFAPQVEDATC